MNKINVNFHLIKDYLKQNHLTIKEFCKACNIKYYNYRQLMLGDGNIKAGKLYKICFVTKLYLKDLIKY